MDQTVLHATQLASAAVVETSKDWLAIVVKITMLDSLPVKLVVAIQLGLTALTAIPMEGVTVKVAMQVISAVSVQVDFSKYIVEDEVEVAQVM